MVAVGRHMPFWYTMTSSLLSVLDLRTVQCSALASVRTFSAVALSSRTMTYPMGRRMRSISIITSSTSHLPHKPDAQCKTVNSYATGPCTLNSCPIAVTWCYDQKAAVMAPKWPAFAALQNNFR